MITEYPDCWSISRPHSLPTKVPGIGTGRFEDYFYKELIPLVDRMFRTIPHRTGRAVDGFSLGGFQSIKAAAQRPDLFCSAGAFDGTFLYATKKGKEIKSRDRILGNPMLSPAFGQPIDREFIASVSPTNLLWRGDSQSLKDVQWLIRSGPESAEPWQSNYFRAQHAIRILKARGIGTGIDPVMPLATHSWAWADRHIEGTLPLHWDGLFGSRKS